MVQLEAHSWEATLAGPRHFLFKHSPRCWLSARAWRQVEAFVAGHPDVPVVWVDVLDQRALARELADRLDVPHASPQVILVSEGAAVWDASHLGVRQGAMERALGR